MRSSVFVLALRAFTVNLVVVVVTVLPVTAPRAAGAAEVESDVPVRVDDLQSLKVGFVQITPSIYKIEGDKLTCCFQTDGGVKERPQAFRTDDRANVVLFGFERVKETNP